MTRIAATANALQAGDRIFFKILEGPRAGLHGSGEVILAGPTVDDPGLIQVLVETPAGLNILNFQAVAVLTVDRPDPPIEFFSSSRGNLFD